MTRAKEMSCFITPWRRFSDSVTPFPFWAEKWSCSLVNKVCVSLTGSAAHLDYVMVYSDTWEAQVQRLKAVVGHFAKATVTYLGRVVGHGEVCLVQAKMETIDKYPSVKRELMWFLDSFTAMFLLHRLRWQNLWVKMHRLSAFAAGRLFLLV